MREEMESRSATLRLQERLRTTYWAWGLAVMWPPQDVLRDLLGEAANEIDRLLQASEGCGSLISHLTRRVEILEGALQGIYDDSLASDFNEHWDSYKAAESALHSASQVGESCPKGLEGSEK